MALPAFGTIKSDATDWHGVETGSVVLWGGVYNSIPAGWLICDGAAVSDSTYAALLAIIGTRYGAGGAGTFNVPDMRNKFPRGAANAASGGTGAGVDTHSHNVQGYTERNTNPFYYYGSYSYGCMNCCAHCHYLDIPTSSNSNVPVYEKFVFIIKT